LQWKNWALWRLLIQGYLLLPLLANLSFNLVLSGLGESRENLAFRVAVGVAVSLAFGLAFGLVVRVAVGVVISVAIAVAFGLAFGLAVRAAICAASIVAIFVGIGLFYYVPIGVTASKVVRIAASVEAVVKPMLKFLRLVAICPLLKLGNNLLYQLDKQLTDSQFSLLRYNSAFWDEWQHQPLKDLDKHLILMMERNPDEGNAAIKYLSTRPQRWAAQAALLEMDTRRIERCVNLEAIRHLHRDLATGELELENLVGALIRSFSHISEDVDAALNQVTTYNQRLTLKSVSNRLDDLSRQLTTSNDEYAIRLQPVPIRWSQIITNHADELAKASEDRQEIDSPYIIGVPLTEEQEIFTGRNDISTRIEQLLLDRRRPPLLLYGQRRMGKTSLLNNLGRLLPNTIVPMFVDLQGAPSSASDYAGFLYNIARGMVNSAMHKRGLTLPPLPREALASDPFTYFDEWLDEVEQALEDKTALLELDEFEELDSAITKGRFDEQDVLGMLRHLIQHRPRFKVLLAGSHTLEEYQRWASYLINVQVVNISYLQEDEARQLIERPVKNFPLRYEPDAVERVLELTRCHPCLVQLLCAEIVALKNELHPTRRRLATSRDVEQAVREALSSGSFFFADIERNQVNAEGLELLRFLAAKGEGATVSKKALSRQFPNRLDSSLNLLLRRELIEQVGDGYRYQVELIRRWFAKQG
jgi:AAA+ ATPase superfamily predicted ATPase